MVRFLSQDGTGALETKLGDSTNGVLGSQGVMGAELTRALETWANSSTKSRVLGSQGVTGSNPNYCIFRCSSQNREMLNGRRGGGGGLLLPERVAALSTKP